MPEMPDFGDRTGLRPARISQSQAFEFRAKIDAVWR